MKYCRGGWFIFLGLILCLSADAQETGPFDTKPKDNLLDSLLGIAIILFILSIITEKITQLFRKYAPFIREKSLLHKTFLSSFWRNISKTQKSDTTKSGQVIEREVNSLSFMIGLVISASFCVDLFMMLKTANPNATLYWSIEKWNYYTSGDGWIARLLLLILSLCLTGFFLTFGSKFFHDLIDTLFQVKTLKRKLNDQRTFNDPQSIEELEDFIKTPELKLSQLAVVQQAAAIRAVPGVLSVGPGYMDISGEKVGCLEIHVNNETTVQALAKTYSITLPSGLQVKVPSNIIVTEDYPVAAIANAGSEIANRTQKLGTGTLGGVVQDKVTKIKYLLSCHHVLNGDFNWKGLSSSKDIVDTTDTNRPVIAKLALGFRTSELDAALAKLPPGSTLTNNSIGSPTSIRKIGVSDAIHQTPVTILGGKTRQKVNGIIYNDTWDTQFTYPDGVLWPLKDLLVLTKIVDNRLTTLTQGGDSGAFVVDKDNIVVGMVVGGDKKFTYAIKMDKIEHEFNIQLA